MLSHNYHELQKWVSFIVSCNLVPGIQQLERSRNEENLGKENNEVHSSRREELCSEHESNNYESQIDRRRKFRKIQNDSEHSMDFDSDSKFNSSKTILLRKQKTATINLNVSQIMDDYPEYQNLILKLLDETSEFLLQMTKAVEQIICPWNLTLPQFSDIPDYHITESTSLRMSPKCHTHLTDDLESFTQPLRTSLKLRNLPPEAIDTARRHERPDTGLIRIRYASVVSVTETQQIRTSGLFKPQCPNCIRSVFHSERQRLKSYEEESVSGDKFVRISSILGHLKDEIKLINHPKCEICKNQISLICAQDATETLISSQIVYQLEVPWECNSIFDPNSSLESFCSLQINKIELSAFRDIDSPFFIGSSTGFRPSVGDCLDVILLAWPPLTPWGLSDRQQKRQYAILSFDSPTPLFRELELKSSEIYPIINLKSLISSSEVLFGCIFNSCLFAPSVMITVSFTSFINQLKDLIEFKQKHFFGSSDCLSPSSSSPRFDLSPSFSSRENNFPFSLINNKSSSGKRASSQHHSLLILTCSLEIVIKMISRISHLFFNKPQLVVIHLNFTSAKQLLAMLKILPCKLIVVHLDSQAQLKTFRTSWCGSTMVQYILKFYSISLIVVVNMFDWMDMNFIKTHLRQKRNLNLDNSMSHITSRMLSLIGKDGLMDHELLNSFPSVATVPIVDWQDSGVRQLVFGSKNYNNSLDCQLDVNDSSSSNFNSRFSLRDKELNSNDRISKFVSQLARYLSQRCGTTADDIQQIVFDFSEELVVRFGGQTFYCD